MLKMIEPMYAKFIQNSFDNSSYLFEFKYDGIRALSDISNSGVQIYSRSQKLIKKFPQINRALLNISKDILFDGEIVVFDKEGRTNFQMLQNWMRSGSGDLYYVIFDVLRFDGAMILDLPLKERKKILSENFPKNMGYILKESEYVIGKGNYLYNYAYEHGLEGIVGKKLNSTYKPGYRGRDWVKIKVPKQADVIIIGYSEPKGSRKYFGALLLGMYDKNKNLIYVGQTSGSFKEQEAKYIYEKLQNIRIEHSLIKQRIRTNREIYWVKPEIIAHVRFSEWTNDGYMRQAVFQGFRDNVNTRRIVKG